MRSIPQWKRSLWLMGTKCTERFLGMLGLARRAGKLIIGTELICRAMPKRTEGRIRLVIISDKASDATRKKLTVKSDFYGIEYIEADIDTEKLGHLLGKTYAPAAVAVTDENFARVLKEESKVEGH